MILFWVIYGCFTYSQKVEQERDQAHALLDEAIAELGKRRTVTDIQRRNEGMRHLLSDLLKDWPADPQVH